MFVHNNLNYTNIDLSAYCKDQDVEVCALNLELTFSNLRIMTVYRAPTGNFELFLTKLISIHKTFYKADSKLIIFVNTNIDYLSDSEKKRQLDAVLLSYNLSAIVHFPTRSQYQSSTAIDYIFIDIYKF
jgi:hypothetical protein